MHNRSSKLKLGLTLRNMMIKLVLITLYITKVGSRRECIIHTFKFCEELEGGGYLSRGDTLAGCRTIADALIMLSYSLFSYSRWSSRLSVPTARCSVIVGFSRPQLG
jgi:hypothetical protein